MGMYGYAFIIQLLQFFSNSVVFLYEIMYADSYNFHLT